MRLLLYQVSVCLLLLNVYLGSTLYPTPDHYGKENR